MTGEKDAVLLSPGTGRGIFHTGDLFTVLSDFNSK